MPMTKQITSIPAEAITTERNRLHIRIAHSAGLDNVKFWQYYMRGTSTLEKKHKQLLS